MAWAEPMSSTRPEPPVGCPLYHPASRDPARLPDSWWWASGGAVPVGVDPPDRDFAVDVAVIGGGYAGLCAALSLARDHDLSACVLEAGPVGWGASGRNGGFCTLGGTKRDLSDIARTFGVGEARSVFDAQRHAVRFVRELARQHRIDLRIGGEGEYVVAHKPSRVAGLEREAEEVAALTGERWELLPREALVERGIALEEAHAALLVPHAFGLHPLRYVRGLARAAVEHGVRVHERTPVLRWEYTGGHHLLHVPGARVRADAVLLATNGYTPEALRPELGGLVLPVLSTILVTRELTASERAAQGWTVPALVADTRELLFYIRLLPEGRILFGARGGLCASPEAFARRREWLERRFRERLPALAHVRIEHAWWGFVALARDLLPHVARLPGLPRAWAVLAFHGGGVSAASWLGTCAAALVAGRAPDGPLPDAFRRPLRRFPLPTLRLFGLAAVMGAMHLRDESW